MNLTKLERSVGAEEFGDLVSLSSDSETLKEVDSDIQARYYQVRGYSLCCMSLSSYLGKSETKISGFLSSRLEFFLLFHNVFLFLWHFLSLDNSIPFVMCDKMPEHFLR